MNLPLGVVAPESRVEPFSFYQLLNREGMRDAIERYPPILAHATLFSPYLVGLAA
jgi:hypothetical protein